MKKNKTTLVLFLGVMLILAVLVGLFIRHPVPQTTVRIAIPQNNFIRNIDQNYYKLWLEKKTGLSIAFEFISEQESEEYLRLLFSSGNSDLDAVFIGGTSSRSMLPESVLQQYGSAGYILPLDTYIDGSVTNFSSLFQEFPDYDLRAAMTSPDGHLYYFPALNESRLTQNELLLWMNIGWIKALGATLPQTTDELHELMTDFATKDPNGNGVRDELPLAGCSGVPGKQVCNFLINSFVYNDPENCRMAVREGKVFFAPATEEYRKALVYLSGLYQDGLLPPLNFTFTEAQLTQIVNDPRDAVGGFCAGNITDVIYSASDETLGSFIHLPPLLGPGGVRYAVKTVPSPTPAGVILSSSKNPQAVFELMDLMLSEEASLVARYGEPDIDWEYAKPGDISIGGTLATINVKTRLSGKVQNKHFAGLGPIVVKEKYADGVSWSGLEADNEYLGSRAAMAYHGYVPAEVIPMIDFDGADTYDLDATRADIERYTDSMLEEFVTGKKDPLDDSDWQEYIAHYSDLQLDRLVLAVQESYDKLLEWRGNR